MKSELRIQLANADFEPIVAAARERARTVNSLLTLTYDPDPLIRWRAIDAIGRCAAQLAPMRTEMLKNHLRRLFWLMNDESGAIAWRAPEAIGEIIRADPRAFADFIPMTISLLNLEPEDLPPFLPGALYALGRIGEIPPDTVAEARPRIEAALTDSNPLARAMAVWCLHRLGAREIILQHPALARDGGKALIYRDEQLMETTVAQLAAEAADAHG